jgi:aminoglycoside 6'-N-acetyltransferase
MNRPRIGFRPLTRLDFPTLVEWMSEPHVAEWWDDHLDLEGVEAEYGPSVDGADPTLAFVILADERPVGFIQTYPLAANPDYAAAVDVPNGAGVDLFVGDRAVMGGGFGSAVIRQFLEQVVWDAFPDVTQCMAGPSVRNLRSQRAFENAGLVRTRVVTVPGEVDDELVMIAPRPQPS